MNQVSHYSTATRLNFPPSFIIFCSNIIMSGGTLKDAKEMIGHKDISITDRYSHLTSMHKHHRQKQLAAHYLKSDLSN